MNKYGPEARDNWIAARIDELMDDLDFIESHNYCGAVPLVIHATTQAEREHAAIMSAVEDERIEQWQGENE